MQINFQKKDQLRNLPHYLQPRGKSSSHYKYIPKKIFQTFYTNEVPKHLYDVVQTWITKNPDWEYHLFDDKQSRKFIEQHFSKIELDAYDELLPGGCKADLWRYCVLYVHGGVYADIKQQLFLSLNKIIPHDVEFLSIKDRNLLGNAFNGYIYQAFICSKPKHPFLKKAINMICKNVQKGYYGPDCLHISGPALMGKAINSCLKRPSLTEIKTGLNIYQDFKFILWPCFDSNKIVLTDKNIEAIKVEYAGYRKYLYKNSPIGKESYGSLWYQGKSYANKQRADPSRRREKHWIRDDITFVIRGHSNKKNIWIQGCLSRHTNLFSSKGKLGLKIKINGRTIKVYPSIRVGHFNFCLPLSIQNDSLKIVIKIILLGVGFTNFLAYLGRVTELTPMPKIVRNLLNSYRGQHKNRRLVIHKLLFNSQE